MIFSPLFSYCYTTSFKKRARAVDGLTIEDSIKVARMMKEWGVDLVDVSFGGILPQPPTSIFPGYQVPFAERIKREAGIATGAIGLITTPEQVEEILGNERADLVFIARELLRDPHWVLRAAKARNVEYIGPRRPPPIFPGVLMSLLHLTVLRISS